MSVVIAINDFFLSIEDFLSCRLFEINDFISSYPGFMCFLCLLFCVPVLCFCFYLIFRY